MARTSKQRGDAKHSLRTLPPSPEAMTSQPNVDDLLRGMARLPLYLDETGTTSPAKGIAALRSRGLIDTIVFSLPGEPDASDLADLQRTGKKPLWIPWGRRKLTSRKLGVRVEKKRAPDGAAPLYPIMNYGNSEGAFFEVQFSVPRVLQGHNDDVTSTKAKEVENLVCEIARTFFMGTIRRLSGVNNIDLFKRPEDIPGLAVTRIDLTGDGHADVHDAIDALQHSRWLRSRRGPRDAETYLSLLFRKGKDKDGPSEELVLYDLGQRQEDKPKDTPKHYAPGFRLRLEMRAMKPAPLRRLVEVVTALAGKPPECPRLPIWIGGPRSEPKTALMPLSYPAMHLHLAMGVSALSRSAERVRRHPLDSAKAVALEALAHPDAWQLRERFINDTRTNPKLARQRDDLLREAEVLRRRFHYPDLLGSIFTEDELCALERGRCQLVDGWTASTPSKQPDLYAGLRGGSPRR